ncbi:MAG: TRAP transporter small permease [Bosea sp. (in: a-proteobacteria)]|uniref:TRAP transporter small permease n=2 Tax=Bosea sp. (in: a-proteobacteria) TaxID=1871050 RepID=UPI002735F36A|nr:TRAP transporter small permease [Bosea sp. (in: a-proteobacteria)]MDP3600593.1 TRAP transporter small permease [Bosea sp. (in: a-proteobacteria)]WRH58681.1 MAG: TRAP transporter small permease [Bosea sp. (in: a-proteobacteria)]
MSQFLISAEFLAAKLLLAAIVILVFIAALGRTFGYPLIWSIDVAQLLFIWVCFLGANRAMRLKAHIGVDLFVRKLPRTPRWLVEIALALLSLAFLIALAVSGYRLTMLNWQRVYGDSGISYAWVTAAVPVGSALLALTITINLVHALRTRSLVFYADRSLDRSDSQLG